ncbi:MAG: ATP-binding protein [Sphaerochaetaceae bacterium]
MQVSQQDTHITHAVLGNQESVSMGVSNDAALMHIFSATLYTYPRLATVREIICNAWDAHIASGITDRPVEVTVEANRITVRDYGYGIPHAKIGEIYGTYGNSTKRDDSTVTGGFGLGSKAPFAYTDNFEVVSHHVGTKTIYRVSKSSMEKGGKPTINKIVDMPTQETGMQVAFGLIKEEDSNEFMKLITEVIQLGEIPVKLNGQLVELELPMSQSPTGYLINNFRSTIKSRVKLRYGNVVYPIPEHDIYAELYRKALLDMEYLGIATNIIFMAEPDSITIAPSRETLILTDTTVEAITQLLKKYEPYNRSGAGKTATQVAQKVVNQRIKAEPVDRLKTALLKQEFFDTRVHLSTGGANTFTTAQKAITAKALREGSDIPNSVQQIKVIKELKARGVFDRKLASKMVRSYSTMGRSRYERTKEIKSLFNRFVVAPINLAILQKYPEMKDVNTRCYMRQGYRAGSMYKNMHEAYKSTSDNFLPYFNKTAVIGRSIKEVEIFLDKEYAHKHCFVYVILVGSGKEAGLRAVAGQLMMEELGYAVLTHFPERVKATRKPALATDGTVALDALEKPRKKKDSYYTLSHSYCPTDNNFLLSRAREKYTTETMVSDPVAYAVLNNKGECPWIFAYIAKDACQIINKLFGDQIAVVTAIQAEKLKQKGVPRVDAFINKYVDEQLTSSPDFKRYLAGAFHFAGSNYMPEKLMHAICFHPEFINSLGMRLHINPEAAVLIELAKHASYDFSNYPGVVALLDKIKPNEKLMELKTRLVNSRYFQVLGTSGIHRYLTSYPANSPEVQPAYEILRLAFK